MHKVSFPIVLSILSFSSIAFAEEAASLPSEEATSLAPKRAALEEIVVSGKRPGPPLWKVSSGDHVLWIFATLQPLPKSLEWQRESVLWIISQADEFIRPPTVSANTSNPFKAARLVSKLRKLRKNTENKTLDTILTPELFAILLATIERIGANSNKILKLKPAYAAKQLSEVALNTVGLTNEQNFKKELLKMAKKQKIQITSTEVEVDLSTGWNIVSAVPLHAEIDCLETTLEAINTDLQASLERALAWVEGNALLLKQLEYPDVEKQCSSKLYSTPEAVRTRQESRALWLQAARQALTHNSITFSNLPIRELVHPKGLLETLHNLGYVISGRE